MARLSPQPSGCFLHVSFEFGMPRVRLSPPPQKYPLGIFPSLTAFVKKNIMVYGIFD